MGRGIIGRLTFHVIHSEKELALQAHFEERLRQAYNQWVTVFRVIYFSRLETKIEVQLYKCARYEFSSFDSIYRTILDALDLHSMLNVFCGILFLPKP